MCQKLSRHDNENMLEHATCHPENNLTSITFCLKKVQFDTIFLHLIYFQTSECGLG